MPAEIRKEELFKRNIIVAPKRAKRPDDFDPKNKIKPICPFCPKNISAPIIDQIGADKNWQVISLKNQFPAVTSDNNRAYGYQEVIVESPDHNKCMEDLSDQQVAQVLEMFARRTKKLSEDKKIEYILCLKNFGPKAGTSLLHSHSQIFATEYLPFDIKDEQKIAKNYRQKNSSCYYCDLLKKENKTKRKVWSDKNIIVFAPFTSQYSYEVWIFTKRHVDNITQLRPAEIKSLAQALKKILLKLKKLDLSYNFFLHQIISDRDQHFCLKIQPRAGIFGGVELGSGLYINPISPEEAAKLYRE